MTVNIVSPAIISRAEFNLNAGQTKTPPLVRMDFGNLVTNGGFDTDTDWTKGTGWTIAAGVASLTPAGGSSSNLTQSIALSSALTFKASVDCTITAGGLTILYSGVILDTVASTQTSLSTFSPSTANENFVIQANASFDGSVDNVSIYEADPSDDAPWLRLPYGYSVGRTGMIVRDGVILHPSDYTEIKDSGQTWIKPIVAPGVSTEFSIWGSTA